jgi:hypothetical protein
LQSAHYNRAEFNFHHPTALQEVALAFRHLGLDAHCAGRHVERKYIDGSIINLLV